MPPKKGAKVKSPKLSKAEKERLKKEESERKAKEEEEARLQAEQEQREKEERERFEREEKEKLAQQEREQHQAEVDELNGMLDEKYDQLKNAENKNRENAKWKRYMLCDGTPDPKISKEINTYMNLWKEDTTPKAVHKTLQESHDALKLIDELQRFLGDEPGLTDEDIEKHNESITRLQNLISDKLDEATMHILKNPGDNIDPDTQNIQFEIMSRLISLNIWGNISRNPRIKSLTFDKETIVMEIPKSLSVGNFAVRSIFTGYDHLSEKCRLFFPRKKKLPEVQEPVVEVNEETASEDKKKDENDDVSLPVPESVRTALSPKPPSSSRSARKSREKLTSSPPTGRKSRRKSAKSQREEPSPVEPDTNEGKESELVATPEDTESKKPVDNRKLSQYIEFDEDDDEDVVDLRAFSTTSKVISMDLFELPPQAKVVKGWTIQQIVPPELVGVPYEAQLKSTKSEEFVSSENEPAEDTAVEKSDSSSEPENSTGNPPIAITMRLPVDVCYFEQPQVARWDANKNHWRLDGFTDIQFNDKSNILTFKTDRFSHIGIFQDLYLNMPFQSWEIRPHGVNSCLMTIVAAAIDLEIEIKDSLCCVSHAEDSVQRLRHLAGKWFPPKDLIKKLKSSGVNIFPAVDAEKYVSVNVKDPALEKSIYEQIALTASSYAYSWSRWNSDCGKDKIVIQATEQLKDEPSMEDEWFVFFVCPENSCKLKLNEFDETFSDDIAENTKLHADLYHMVTDGATECSISKIKDTSFQFFDCILQLLNATKVLTYS